jgi:peroxiredoxin Q/BCP
MRTFVTCCLGAGLLSIGLFPAAVRGAEEASRLQGKPAPAIDLPATQVEKALPDKKEARTLSLADLKGKKIVVLFFYPKAMTPGCTVESCGFTKIADKLAALDAVAIGISTDTIANQQKFTEKEKLTTPLFADADKKVAQEYGVLDEKRGLARRVTFVIDKDGIVRKVYTKVVPSTHPAEVLEYIKQNLQ